jgi:hypothetical protein
MNMRRLIDIAAGRKPTNLTESVLTEAQNYEAMFAPIMKMLDALPPETSALNPNRPSLRAETEMLIREEIAWAKKTLRKNDRIVWYLRIIRFSLADGIVHAASILDSGEPSPRYLPAVEVIYNKLQNDLVSKTGSVPGRGTHYMRQSFEHYLSLPIPAIQNTVWDSQSPDQLLGKFQQLEREWQTQQSELIPHDPEDPNDGQVVMTFEDGMMWVLLPRPYCRAEGGAMGHCGNSASYRSGDRLLSLRRKVKGHDGHLYWRPSLTFILDRDNMLGEMKGRENNKPSQKYHQHIMALLMDQDLIQGIKGGGYAPENNFSVNDLTHEEQERLFEARPDLATATWYLKRHGFDDTFKEMVIREFKAYGAIEAGIKEYWDGQNLRVLWWRNWQELVKEWGNHSAAYYTKEHYIHEFDFGRIGNEEIESFIRNQLPKKTWKLIVEYLKRTYNLTSDNPDYEEDYDPDSIDDMVRLMEEQCDSLHEAFVMAIQTGREHGTEKEINEALESAIRDAELRYGRFVVQGESDHPFELAWDVPVYLELNLDEICKLIENPEELDEGWIEKKAINIDSDNGFDDFDEESALDTFYDHAPNEFDTRRKFDRDPYQMSDEEMRAEIAELAPTAYGGFYRPEDKIRETIEKARTATGPRLRHILFDIRRKVSHMN